MPICKRGHTYVLDKKRGCPTCQKIRSRIWQKANPDKVANSGYRYRYGITLEDKQRMCDEQNGKCAICLKAFASKWDTCVDHNHSTGQVRRLLCQDCNVGFECFKENPEIIKRLLKYAEEYF